MDPNSLLAKTLLVWLVVMRRPRCHSSSRWPRMLQASSILQMPPKGAMQTVPEYSITHKAYHTSENSHSTPRRIILHHIILLHTTPPRRLHYYCSRINVITKRSSPFISPMSRGRVVTDVLVLSGVTATNTVSALMGLTADGKVWPKTGDEGEFVNSRKWWNMLIIFMMKYVIIFITLCAKKKTKKKNNEWTVALE